MVHRNRMRWYNPKLGSFEWRDMPEYDMAAIALLEGHLHSEDDAAIYREWRALGASVTASLLRAGEAARKRDEA